MNLNVQVLCSACTNCRKLNVHQDDLWADNMIYDKLFYCEHLEICKNAVEIMDKWEESVKED